MLAWIEKRAEFNIILLENILQLKDDVSNCQKFAQQLSHGVDIFVNDAFSEVHKILASTVGIACFCSACIAGFQFQLGLSQLEKIVRTDKKPYAAIVFFFRALFSQFFFLYFNILYFFQMMRDLCAYLQLNNFSISCRLVVVIS